MALSGTTYRVRQEGQTSSIGSHKHQPPLTCKPAFKKCCGRRDLRASCVVNRLCPVLQFVPSGRAMQSVVEFDNVGLRYGTGAETLTDLSFTLFPGSFYFLTGASGAGKTSLLKLLYLAHRPSRGAIRMFGHDAITLPRERLPGFRRRIGVVFQDFRLVQHLSTFDNIALPLRIAGIQEKDLRGPVTEMLAWIGLTERADARPATLSGGEQQRVAIARAVIGRPEVLVADEPTGNVDPDMARRLLQLFAALNRLGTTVVVATHDIHLLQEIENAQMMRLDKGRLSDPTGSLKHPPRPLVLKN
jgi:cell division transport system ATP-binding protein